MTAKPQIARGTPAEVLRAFARLGVSSFGGPIAHLGYFRHEFVTRRGWIDDAGYADLVALCQFLPGPASSQVGFSIGLARAGYLGGLAAWTGFTLPSALALTAFAYAASRLQGAVGEGLLHGLKLVAVAIVAQAVLGMARTLCPDAPRATIAAAALLAMSAAGGSVAQLWVLVAGGAAGLVCCRSSVAVPAASDAGSPVSHRAAVCFLAAYFVLLGLSFAPAPSATVALWDAIYRSGALVFGGGHVVLPLLRTAVVDPGWVSNDAFLAGYGAAQAVPGPLFSFAAYLGAAAGGVLGAAVALVAIFVPGMLALMGTLPFWHTLRSRPLSRAAMAGVNAAVVGLLAAALYDLVWTSAVRTPLDFALAAAGFVLLVAWRTPPVWVVAAGAAAGAVQAVAGYAAH
jgi:chromate transporter